MITNGMVRIVAEDEEQVVKMSYDCDECFDTREVAKLSYDSDSGRYYDSHDTQPCPYCR